MWANESNIFASKHEQSTTFIPSPEVGDALECCQPLANESISKISHMIVFDGACISKYGIGCQLIQSIGVSDNFDCYSGQMPAIINECTYIATGSKQLCSNGNGCRQMRLAT